MSSHGTQQAGDGSGGHLRLANFVGGRSLEATDGVTVPIVDPSTGEAYLEAPVSGPKDVDAAMAAAAAAFPGWRDATPSERSLALIRIADALERTGR